MPPGESAASGSVWARPSSVARLVSVPARSTVYVRPSRTADGRGLLEQRRGLLDAGRAASTRSSRRSSKPSLPRARSCRVAGPDDGVDDFAGWSRRCCVGDRGREHERDRDRDAEAGEQLLGGVHAQPACGRGRASA